MSAHTPGPWEIAEGGTWKNGSRIHTEIFVRQKGDNVSIAADILDPETGEPSEANARLIAAAPDLLAALKEARAYYIETTGNRPTSWDAAIAKAERNQ